MPQPISDCRLPSRAGRLLTLNRCDQVLAAERILLTQEPSVIEQAVTSADTDAVVRAHLLATLRRPRKPHLIERIRAIRQFFSPTLRRLLSRDTN